MCGIVGYTGKQEATPIILEGLRKLEYRGYDSAGVCVINAGHASIRRSEGKLANLDKLLSENPTSGEIGIGHTRWATHGAPTECNAHPHCDTSGRLALIHNGIIENYRVLRTFLEQHGATFTSETDTEVLTQLVAHFYEGELEEAVRRALREVRGTFGIAVLHLDEPDKIVAARRGSPLIVGVGQSEYVLASDAAAILSHTPQVIYLSDNEVAILERTGFRTTNL
ncbi:MAG: glutamine--fructose-6-phosphate aminotransferase, partial [Deltaproteobacteria bacterium]